MTMKMKFIRDPKRTYTTFENRMLDAFMGDASSKSFDLTYKYRWQSDITRIDNGPKIEITSGDYKGCVGQITGFRTHLDTYFTKKNRVKHYKSRSIAFFNSIVIAFSDKKIIELHVYPQQSHQNLHDCKIVPDNTELTEKIHYIERLEFVKNKFGEELRKGSLVLFPSTLDSNRLVSLGQVIGFSDKYGNVKIKIQDLLLEKERTVDPLGVLPYEQDMDLETKMVYYRLQL